MSGNQQIEGDGFQNLELRVVFILELGAPGVLNSTGELGDEYVMNRSVLNTTATTDRTYLHEMLAQFTLG